jgi:hypothetical protein
VPGFLFLALGIAPVRFIQNGRMSALAAFLFERTRARSTHSL